MVAIKVGICPGFVSAAVLKHLTESSLREEGFFGLCGGSCSITFGKLGQELEWLVTSHLQSRAVRSARAHAASWLGCLRVTHASQPALFTYAVQDCLSRGWCLP